MELTQVIQKVETLEQQLEQLQRARKEVHNSEVVYDTQSTLGYAQWVETQGGKVVYLSGMTPWNKEMQLEEEDLIGQLDHAMINLEALLKSKQLTLQHLISIRFYVAQPNYYDQTQAFVTTLQNRFGQEGINCALTLVGVTGLAEPQQLIEVEAIAVY